MDKKVLDNNYINYCFQCDRTAAFKKFHNAAHGILLCTDVVSRGLDLPNVDLVVQMSVPPLVEDYVHRVGRTARVGSKGRSILVLLPSETKFVHHLQGHIQVEMNPVKVEQYMDTLNKLAVFESNKQLHTEQERLAFLQVSAELFHVNLMNSYICSCSTFLKRPSLLMRIYIRWQPRRTCLIFVPMLPTRTKCHTVFPSKTFTWDISPRVLPCFSPLQSWAPTLAMVAGR